MMFHKIRSRTLDIKITDLIGVLGLVYPIYLLLQGQLNLFFYVGAFISLILLGINFFGINGYYVKANKPKIVMYDGFIPQIIKIKNIIEIEKKADAIILTLSNGQIVKVNFSKIAKNQKYKTNDFYYDIHNIVQRNTLKV